MSGSVKSRLQSHALPLLLLFLMAAIGCAGYLYYRSQREALRRQQQDQLLAVADMKVHQIASWRSERLADAAAIASSPIVARALAQLLKGAPGLDSDFRIWLNALRERCGYKAAFVFDDARRVRLSVPAEHEPDSDLEALVTAAAHRRTVLLSDLYRSQGSGEIHMDLAIPIVARGSSARPIGTIVLRIDPHQFLYLLVQSSPTPSRTAETLLVRRDGDHVLYLNELRHRKGTAFSLRLPLHQRRLPAAWGVTGREGLIEGIDYRGVPVLAAIRSVPDSGWTMVAKIDLEEVYAPISALARWATLTLGLLLTAVAAGGGLLWRHQQASSYRRQYQAELERTAERLRAQEEIRMLNTELEQRVSELEAVNEELEAFSYSVSHDLRAPLRHLDGFSQLLSEEAGAQLDPACARYLQHIREDARRMGNMVDALLDLSRMGRRGLDRKLTPLRPVVEEVLAGLRPDYEGRNIRFEIGELPSANCDQALVKLVFTNLLSNAVKFTRPREPAIIQVGQTTRDGCPVIFVRDNGVGFNMKYAGKLFGAFQRLHTREEFEGTGIGLATVRRIIQKHGGAVWAEAAPDGGATFFFTLEP